MAQEALLGRLGDLEAKLQEQQELIESQSQTIMQLQTTHTPPVQQPTRTHNGASSVRAPSISFFSGEGEGRTSAKVKSFIYNVKKAGVFSGIGEDRLLALAECYCTDSAAAWLMRLESRGEKPTDVNALQVAMLKEFVPPDERARAKFRLMEKKMTSSMDEHVTKFKKLVEITEVPENEEYIFFFMRLSGKYK